MIIFRYLTREISAALLSITSVLLAIFMSNQLVRYLSYAADGRLEFIAILKLLILEIPHLSGLLLPLGLYLAILLVFGRLYLDQEMTVLGACGVSRKRIIKMLMPLTLGITVLVGILALGINPSIMNFRNQLLEQAGSETTLKTMLPGRFQELSGGQRIVYAGQISANRQQLQDLFIAEQTEEEGKKHWDILVAAKGYQYFDKKAKAQFVVTTDSYRYIGVPGENKFQVVKYGKYGVKVQNKRSVALTEEDALPTWALLKMSAKHLQQMAELQWRVSLPLMALVLALLAVPLSRIQRGQGKYARFLPAILIYVIYANMLIVSRSWIARGILPAYIGMWWPHAAILLSLAVYYGYDYAWRHRRVPWLSRRYP